MSDKRHLVLLSAAIGAVAGMRSMSAPAIVTRRIGPRWLHLGFMTLAAGEMAADKTKYVSDRTDPLPLTGRIVMGGVCAAAVAHSAGGHVAGAAVIGGAAATGSAFLFNRLRKATTSSRLLPDAVVALAEDGIVLAAGREIDAHMPTANGQPKRAVVRALERSVPFLSRLVHR